MTFPSNVFEPEDLAQLSAAFEASWRALRFAFPDRPASDRGRQVRDDLARRIVGLAQHGERDPRRLSTEALRSLPPLPAA